MESTASAARTDFINYRQCNPAKKRDLCRKAKGGLSFIILSSSERFRIRAS
jgi:hypothetical protein